MMNELFHKFAHKTSNAAGSSWAFIVALSVVVVWAISGPIFHFSETWQLFINTGTTIVTFLMVFLVQNAQNRESKATQLKLDELVRALRGASNKLIDAEDLSDDELASLKQKLTDAANRREQHRKSQKS